MNQLAEITRRWMSFHDLSDTYNYCVFSKELVCCDLGIYISRKNCASCSLAKAPEKLTESQPIMKKNNLLAC